MDEQKHQHRDNQQCRDKAQQTFEEVVKQWRSIELGIAVDVAYANPPYNSTVRCYFKSASSKLNPVSGIT